MIQTLQQQNLTFKLERKNKKILIVAYVNKQIAGYIEFEILKSNVKLFTDEEEYKQKIVEKLIDNNQYIYIAYIVVNDKFRGIGIANKLMTKFDNFWLSNNIDFVILSACPFEAGKVKGLPLEILTKFYEKFNFEKIIVETDNVLMFKEK